MAGEFRTLESFGAAGDGITDDQPAIKAALVWSGGQQIPVYGFHSYLLGATLPIPKNATLIATPTARFIRGFGDAVNTGNGADALVGTVGDQPNIRIEGGIWGMEVDRAKASISFTNVSTGGSNTASFTDAKALFFTPAGAPRPGVLQQLWVYKRDDNGDYDPGVPNNNTIFPVTGFVDDTTLTLGDPPVATTSPVNNMFASQVPRAGSGFKVVSTGGVIDGVGLIYPRGIQFQLRGHGFLITRSWSRNPTPDAGGGVRFDAGRGMRGTLLDIESSDDCFQFNPSDNGGDHETVAKSSFVDCLGRTNQGALIAFINGGGSTYDPAQDSLTTLADCYARNIRGSTGGSVVHGGVGIKIWCANSSVPITNCWAEDVYIRQSEATPADKLRAGVLILTGRSGGGVLNSGVRNLVVASRSGPMLAIAPADGVPTGYAYSKTVDFTLEQARAPGAGSWPGLPLVTAAYADRLVLRDIAGDLSGDAGNPGRALEIGTALTYTVGGVGYLIAAGTVGELVIDGCATGNAALPSTKGLWRFGNVGKASVRRLSAAVVSGATPGGIELTQQSSDPGPSWCRFAEVDFTGIATPIVTWQSQVGNGITRSIGFDDRSEAVPPLAIGATAIAPARFAPTIVLALASGVTSASVASMTPPGVPAPRCTLLVPTGVTVANTGTGTGAFQMPSPLAGSATASLTVQWLAAGNRWREVPRTA